MIKNTILLAIILGLSILSIQSTVMQSIIQQNNQKIQSLKDLSESLGATNMIKDFEYRELQELTAKSIKQCEERELMISVIIQQDYMKVDQCVVVKREICMNGLEDEDICGF